MVACVSHGLVSREKRLGSRVNDMTQGIEEADFERVQVRQGYVHIAHGDPVGIGQGKVFVDLDCSHQTEYK